VYLRTAATQVAVLETETSVLISSCDERHYLG